MPEIKTRDHVARTVRSMNRVHNLSTRIKSNTVRSRDDQIDEKQYAVETTESGAAEMLPHASKFRVHMKNRNDMVDEVGFESENEPTQEPARSKTKENLVSRSRESSRRQSAEKQVSAGEKRIKTIQPGRSRSVMASTQQEAFKRSVVQKTREKAMLLRQRIV